MSALHEQEWECHFRVRSYELDSFGHVNNAVFLNYLEAARGEYLLQAGLSFDEFDRWGAYPVVRRATLSFQAALRVHEDITVVTRFEPLRRTGFRAHQQILKKKSGVVALDALLELIFTDRAGRPIAVPAKFKERVLRQASPGQISQEQVLR